LTQRVVPRIRPIAFDDIQLLRYWRNLDHVNQRMVKKGHVTNEGQRVWFEVLDHSTSLYFIYGLGARDVGSVSLTNIDSARGAFEGGVFCGDVAFIGHWINVWACIQIYENAFDSMGLQTSFATILSDNAPAISLNSAIGYKFVEEVAPNIGRYRLDREDFEEASKGMKRFLSRYA